MGLTPITNVSEIAEGYEAAKAREDSGGNRTPYAKLSSATWIGRILPSFEANRPVPYTGARLHRYNDDEGKFKNAMDYDFLLDEPELAAAAVSSGRITETDLELAKQFGDPFKVLCKRLKDLGKKNEDIARGIFSRARYWFLVVPRDDERVHILEVGGEMRDKFMGQMALYPNMFDLEEGNDMLVQGNGRDGIGRRYPTVGCKAEPVPVGIELTEETVPSLNEKLVYMVQPFVDKVANMFRLFPEECAEVGLSYADFGVTDGE